MMVTDNPNDAACDTPCHDAKAALIEALRDNLSPEAVAIIARRLTPTPASGYRELDAEVTWFATLLAETLGGQQERIIQELELE